ncbi:HAD family hydrolase [Paratissierella segnis]|jgi:HAD superfamily hydrolase (TIGR01509 family)|uniref:HAD family phosphatase n=1 Tax=Paratissierella segnis TaxID=2763679 RepID=A0A926IJN1_9FIRM|nr:HAD family phosphatase [Paratissierella segnis]MBC8588194.1 HAD family phosphatase [Paratissierella segnis]
MIKAIIFDMDGLMLDSERVKLKYRNMVKKELGLDYENDTISETFGKTLAEIRQININRYGNDYPQEKISKRSRALWNEHIIKYGVPIKKGLLDLLKFLKDNEYKIAVATSTYEEETEYLLKLADIIHYFDIIVTGDQVMNSKPNPDIYIEASKRLSIDPVDCVALEDSPNGVISASKAGMKVIMVPDLIEPDDELKKTADFVVSGLGDVVQILKKELI